MNKFFSASVLATFFIMGCGNTNTANTTSPTSTTSRVYNYTVVDTGQSKTYGATSEISTPAVGQPFYGQDAQFSSNTPSYTNNDDGTVTDLITGLMWQRDYDNRPHTWSEAQSMISALNQQKLGGYSDWRLPTIKELYSLWDASTGWPYINTTYFPVSYKDVQELGHTIFFSSTGYAGLMETSSSTTPGDHPGAQMVFGVNFGTGHIKGYSIDYSATPSAPQHFFRFVRGNTSYGVNSFHSNGNGTITDLATGLMWQQTDSGSGMDWEHALAYAQAKNQTNFLGHSDWRLPNAKELQSLVDYSRSPDATTASNVGPAIDPLFTCTGITNEAGTADYPYYWTSTSARFDTASNYDSAWYVAFGRAADVVGKDLHGAGAVRFDKKAVGTLNGEDAERVINYVRLVRNSQ